MATVAQAITQGMRTSIENAIPDFTDSLHSAVVRTANKNRFFTTDDVWDELASAPYTGGDRSVLGPIMNAAKKLGIIERLPGEYRTSKTPTRHGAPLRVWRSMVINA